MRGRTYHCMGVAAITFCARKEEMTSTDFFVSLTIYDPKNGRHVFFKTDGKRFEEDRTVKISCDVKYDLTVTVRPPGIENLTLL